MDQILTAQIYKFLHLENPTEAQIIEGATLLLRCNPNRERGVYNSAMRRPKAMLPWIRTDLKKYYDIRQRGLTMPEVEQFNHETVSLVEQTLSQRPETVEEEQPMPGNTAPFVPVLGVRGLREDHEQLPDDIKAIWERNAERWKKMRQLHFQLAQMIGKPGYAPCDGNELCYQLRLVDDELRNDYEIYDTYDVGNTVVSRNSSDSPDHVDVFTDSVKTIQNARTAISRGLSRKIPHTDESLQKLQDAVNTLYALKQSIKPETIEKLRAVGVSIPQAETDAEG